MAPHCLLAHERPDCYFAQYAMATALSAHLLQRYSTQRSQLREYTGGLPPHKLKQAIASIQDHLNQDLLPLGFKSQSHFTQ